MLRRIAWWRCRVTLSSGVVLDGQLNPCNRQQLLCGTARLPDGRVYRGSFDAQHGNPLAGCELDDDGDRYRGGYNARWQRHGDGEAWLADGTHYKGRFCDDELVEGVVRIPNGTSEVVFEGTLADECFVKGKLTQHDCVYEGEFANNQPHGKGKLTFATGAVQEGTFYAGKLHGAQCKMQLAGGFVYVGEFLDGCIRRGTLYTPTYTYEGEFNEHGRAQGEGTQTYLANDPRLLFTGVWENGGMVRGVCVDEYGTPVDWQNDHALQSRVFGEELGDTAETGQQQQQQQQQRQQHAGERAMAAAATTRMSRGEEAVAMNAYCQAKAREADTLFRDMRRSYVRDATAVARHTGTYPSEYDLGYEAGLRQERNAAAASAQQQEAAATRARDALANSGDECAAATRAARGTMIGELNENMAKMQFYSHKSAQQLASERVDEQFDRFLRTFDRPLRNTATAAAAATTTGGESPSATRPCTHTAHTTAPTVHHATSSSEAAPSSSSSSSPATTTTTPSAREGVHLDIDRTNATWKTYIAPRE